MARLHGLTTRKIVKSRIFNIDNGAGVTIDDVISAPDKASTILAARIVYTTETAGTVAAGNVRLGSTIGGSEHVASTAFVNGSVIGAKTALTIVSGVVAAGAAIHVRHTGVVATPILGEYFVELELAAND